MRVTEEISLGMKLKIRLWRGILQGILMDHGLLIGCSTHIQELVLISALSNGG
jgi:hypothetical protein